MPAHQRPGTTQAGAVRDALTPVVRDLGLLVEDVVLTPAGARRVLRVVVDLADARGGDVGTSDADGEPARPTGRPGPSGPSLDDVAEASRVISEALDAGDLMGATPYVLEVSTPGVDRPLVEPRHFVRNLGRLVEVTTGDGATVLGRVRAAGPVLVLTVAGAKKGTTTTRDLPWSDVVRGLVQVEFSRPDGPPAGASDAPAAGGPPDDDPPDGDLTDDLTDEED